MPRLEVRTPEGVTLGLDVAGPGTRFAAALLDGLLLVTCLLAVALVLSLVSQFDPSGVSKFILLFLGMGFVLFVIAYHVLFHWLRGGQTPGKRALGIRVISTSGEPASLYQLVLRGVLQIADFVPLPLSIGLVSIAVTPKRQRLGDLAAGTLVVLDPHRVRRGLEPWSHETWDSLQVRVLDLTPAMAARFDATDLAFLRDVITRRGLDLDGQVRLVNRVSAHYRARLGTDREPHARALIKELYLFLRGELA